jgi:hypothetical protein
MQLLHSVVLDNLGNHDVHEGCVYSSFEFSTTRIFNVFQIFHLRVCSFFVILVYLKYTHSTYIVLLHSGKMFLLMMADKLGDDIFGTAIETIETEKLFENVIVDDVYGAGNSIDKVTNDLQTKREQS